MQFVCLRRRQEYRFRHPSGWTGCRPLLVNWLRTLWSSHRGDLSSRIAPPPLSLRQRALLLAAYYRGRANVNWAIINGETCAGISIHCVSPDLDGGGILFQEAVPIGPNDTATALYERLNSIQERELGAAVTRALAGDKGIVQETEKATYGCSRIPSDGEIDWKQTSAQIDRLVRALASPFPGAFTYLDSKRLTVSHAIPLCSPPAFVGRIPGRVVGRSTSEGWVDVLTGRRRYARLCGRGL